MPNYQLGKIYRIVCNTTGLNYYGSTCEPTLARRLAGHRTAFKKFKEGKFGNLSSFKCLENENYEIVLVEIFPCNTKMDLHKRERFFIENNDCVNRVVPTRTQHEYIIENKEIIGEKAKLYKNENKEMCKEKSKLYYNENKERISEINKLKYECECGCIITKMNHLRHNLTLKHIAFMNNKTIIQHNILV